MTEKKHLSLSALNRQIRDTVEDAFSSPVWVSAEILEMHGSQAGHRYLELAEKDVFSEKIVAKARANIWANRYVTLSAAFEHTAKTSLRAGLKVLICVTVGYHELYGFSLNVVDIDPAYTLGDLERRKAEIIQKLQEEGILEMNKELEFPLVPQRIAVISSPEAAGYGDFVDQIENNIYNIRFYHCLFPAIMQGDKTEASVIDALEKVFRLSHQFDVLVIIRGGGSRSDLSSFDTYTLASHICQFNLPVVSGIGHDRDESIIDIVAHTNVKTPTAAAELLISTAGQFLAFLDNSGLIIEDYSKSMLVNSGHMLNQAKSDVVRGAGGHVNKAGQLNSVMSLMLARHSQAKITESRTILNRKSEGIRRQGLSFLNRLWTDGAVSASRIGTGLKYLINRQSEILNQTGYRIAGADPGKILKRGFSLTYLEGKLIRSVSDAKGKQKITTRLSDGIIESEVINSQKENG